MRIRARDAFLFFCGTAFSITCLPGEAQASDVAASRSKPASHAQALAARPSAAAKPGVAHKVVARAAPRYSGPILQCVTFARDVTGLHISGNAHTWWYGAQGRFARGQRPEVGAVLNFRASGGMRLGHVSVVSRVVSAREILVDDANWAAPGQRKGMVRRGASVIDVSPANDWTEVRVANGIGSWGRVYPTYGFIYPRADRSDAPERIEIAAERTHPPAAELLTRTALRSRTAPATITSSGWTWQGTTTVSMGDAAAPPAVRTVPQPSAAAAVRPASPPRWTWVNGQAIARD